MKKTIIGAVLAIFTALSTSSAWAASCRIDYFRVCNGCTADATWKVRRFNKTEKNRWCSIQLRSAGNAFNGFRIIKSFRLGETNTHTSRVAISALRTGRDSMVVEFQLTDRYGKNHISTLNVDIEVVEGEF